MSCFCMGSKKRPVRSSAPPPSSSQDGGFSLLKIFRLFTNASEGLSKEEARIRNRERRHIKTKGKAKSNVKGKHQNQNKTKKSNNKRRKWRRLASQDLNALYCFVFHCFQVFQKQNPLTFYDTALQISNFNKELDVITDAFTNVFYSRDDLIIVFVALKKLNYIFLDFLHNYNYELMEF